MNRFTPYLWLIPMLPLLAAAASSVAPRRARRLAAGTAIGSMALALVGALVALAATLHAAAQGQISRHVFTFRWLQIGENWLELGWVLDPLSAVMLVMVTFVGLLIFIYSVGYMAHDENFTRFFCFLSLFAAAMLGLVIANSLLLLFICWEVVGLTSYLLIGFWYHKPAAAAAAKKAFITTRIGDLSLLLGMVWLYSQSGTLLFYSSGTGCLEPTALITLASHGSWLGIGSATLVGLLIFGGAIGKSGQLPLHVWLPDAMEGPTPVSALIHAATMVAAGVFMVARTFPLMAAPGLVGGVATALHAITWVGALTALFAASIAVAQTDIKRILAYSTVSQLGFMMLGLGVGGVAVGMFHLITHAFFKALLFMGAGSVIHGCQEEQDIRCLGGLRKIMPVTFTTYAVGMMALSGVPILFSGFWSKDEILHAAHGWQSSHWPFYIGLAGAFLTAFYMTRQMAYVFFGNCRLRLGKTSQAEQRLLDHAGAPEHLRPTTDALFRPHESPPVMLIPLVALAIFTVLLGFIGTPAWPAFQAFIAGNSASFALRNLFEPEVLRIMLFSTAVALSGLVLGWWVYARRGLPEAGVDPLEQRFPNGFALLRRKFLVDEIYNWSFVRLTHSFATACSWLDRWLIDGVVELVSLLVVGFSWTSRLLDEHVVNRGFDQSCGGLNRSGGWFAKVQNGNVQRYLKILGIGAAVLALLLIWGSRAA